MSSWPLISDFARVLQNPKIAFRAEDLRQCTVEMNQIGQPKARSGNFATVYRGYRKDATEFAIRVFNRRQDERLEHYRTISDYLEKRSLSSIVKFEYDERGIRSAGDGKQYPLLIMEWVPGITLFEWARDRCRENYAEALQIAADVWLHLVRELLEQNVVHGDLQHGNVMVSPEGHFKLVDYDCMCVPSLVGHRNLETGMVPYQHPGRNAETRLFLGLDNFSSLVIYVALRALAASPYLWITHVDQPEYDKMLFRPQDFENPAASALYHDLMNSPDEQVRDLTHYLFELSRYSLHDIPPVDDVLLWCETLDNLISTQQWERALKLYERMGTGEYIAPEMQPYVVEAQQRVACRKAVEEALQHGDEERVAQIYATGLLHNYPDAAHLLEPASQAAEVVPLLQAMQAARQQQAWETLKQTYLAHQQVLNNRVSAQPYRQEVERLLAVDRIRETLAAPQPDRRAVLDAWDFLEQHGGHPLAEPLRPQMEPFIAWRQSVGALEYLFTQAPKVPTLAFDKKFVLAGTPESLHGLDQESPLVKYYQAASKRLDLVRKVHEVEQKGTVQSETFIANVMQRLPASYHEGLARRSQQARKRLVVYRDLVRAIQEQPCIEANIVQSWIELGQVRGRVLASPEIKARAELAEARVPLIQALQDIPETASVGERAETVLAVWNDQLLGGCPEAQPWLPVYLKAQAFRESVRKLEEAVQTDNGEEIERLMQAPCMQGRDLPSELGERVRDIRQKTQQAAAAKRQAIINALRENDRLAFVQLFDAPTLAEIARQSKHHQPLINHLMETEILPLDKLGLASDPAAAIRRDEQGELFFLWTWPAPNISQECRLAITKNRPPVHVLPDDVPADYKAVVRRTEWKPEVGYQLTASPEWEGASVFVWAVIDLGYQVFFSPPLELGPVKPAAAPKRRWGLFRGWRSEKPAKDEAAAAPDAAPAAAAPEPAPPSPPPAAGDKDLPPPPARS